MDNVKSGNSLEWFILDTIPITWTSHNFESDSLIYITLQTVDSDGRAIYVMDIAQQVNVHDEAYSWVIPGDLETNNTYVIVIGPDFTTHSSMGFGTYAMSTPFTIIGAGFVFTDLVNNTAYTSENTVLKWTSYGFDDSIIVTLNLWVNITDGASYTLSQLSEYAVNVSATDNSHTFVFPPSMVTGSNYHFYFNATLLSNETVPYSTIIMPSIGHEFSITGPTVIIPPPDIPNPVIDDEGQKVAIVVHIQWDPSYFIPNQTVTIQLYRYGIFIRNLTTVISSSGHIQSEYITLPSDLEPGDGYSFNIVQGSVKVETSPFTLPAYPSSTTASPSPTGLTGLGSASALSGGAIAGIVIAVCAVALALLFLVARRTRKQQEEKERQPIPQQEPIDSTYITSKAPISEPEVEQPIVEPVQESIPEPVPEPIPVLAPVYVPTPEPEPQSEPEAVYSEQLGNIYHELSDPVYNEPEPIVYIQPELVPIPSTSALPIEDEPIAELNQLRSPPSLIVPPIASLVLSTSGGMERATSDIEIPPIVFTTSAASTIRDKQPHQDTVSLSSLPISRTSVPNSKTPSQILLQEVIMMNNGFMSNSTSNSRLFSSPKPDRKLRNEGAVHVGDVIQTLMRQVEEPAPVPRMVPKPEISQPVKPLINFWGELVKESGDGGDDDDNENQDEQV